MYCVYQLASAVAVAPLLVVASFGIDLTAEHIQAIAHMKHGIRVNAVVSSVATTRGVDPSVLSNRHPAHCR